MNHAPCELRTVPHLSVPYTDLYMYLGVGLVVLSLTSPGTTGTLRGPRLTLGWCAACRCLAKSPVLDISGVHVARTA